MSGIPENLAAGILIRALYEQRAGELLDALMDGGMATVDAFDGHLVIVDGNVTRRFLAGAIDPPEV